MFQGALWKEWGICCICECGSGSGDGGGERFHFHHMLWCNWPFIARLLINLRLKERKLWWLQTHMRVFRTQTPSYVHKNLQAGTCIWPLGLGNKRKALWSHIITIVTEYHAKNLLCKHYKAFIRCQFVWCVEKFTLKNVVVGQTSLNCTWTRPIRYKWYFGNCPLSFAAKLSTDMCVWRPRWVLYI